MVRPIDLVGNFSWSVLRSSAIKPGEFHYRVLDVLCSRRREDMRSHSKLPVLLSVALLLGPLCYGATIAGTVKDPYGAPFEGATIQAQNTKTRITTIVLSDSHGHYRVENLPAGEYRVQIRAVGYRSNPHTGVNLTPDQNTSVDISLEKGTVHWNDLSIYQAGKLWPA